MKNLLIAFTILICFAACSKAKKYAPGFESITERDLTGQQLGGTVDATDWQTNDEFTKCEKEFFADSIIKGIKCNVSAQAKAAAYPNACKGKFNLSFTVPSDIVNLDIVVVSKNFEVLKKEKLNFFFGFANVSIDLTSSVNSGDFVRVYYVMSSSACSYTGHGDIKIVK